MTTAQLTLPGVEPLSKEDILLAQIEELRTAIGEVREAVAAVNTRLVRVETRLMHYITEAGK